MVIGLVVVAGVGVGVEVEVGEWWGGGINRLCVRVVLGLAAVKRGQRTKQLRLFHVFASSYT